MKKSYTEISKEAANLDFEAAKEKELNTREKFLEKMPQMKDGIENLEKHYGTFLFTNSVNFPDGRFVLLTKWEKVYTVIFYNEQNAEGSKEKEITLSYEALNALMTLCVAFKDDEDTRRFWTAIGMDAKEVEEELLKRQTGTQTKSELDGI